MKSCGQISEKNKGAQKKKKFPVNNNGKRKRRERVMNDNIRGLLLLPIKQYT